MFMERHSFEYSFFLPFTLLHICSSIWKHLSPAQIYIHIRWLEVIVLYSFQICINQLQDIDMSMDLATQWKTLKSHEQEHALKWHRKHEETRG